MSDIKAKELNQLGIEYAAILIKAMPRDEAIQHMKSDLTGLPVTSEINGSLVVIYVPEN